MKTHLSFFISFCIALSATAQQAAPYTDVPKGAFIDTEFKPDSNTRVVMDVTVQSEFEYWFGAWSVDWDICAFAASNDGNGVFTAYGSNSYDATPCGTEGSIVSNGQHVIDFDKGVFKVDGAVHTTRTGSFGRLAPPSCRRLQPRHPRPLRSRKASSRARTCRWTT